MTSLGLWTKTICWVETTSSLTATQNNLYLCLDIPIGSGLVTYFNHKEAHQAFPFSTPSTFRKRILGRKSTGKLLLLQGSFSTWRKHRAWTQAPWAPSPATELAICAFGARHWNTMKFSFFFWKRNIPLFYCAALSHVYLTDIVYFMFFLFVTGGSAATTSKTITTSWRFR